MYPSLALPPSTPRTAAEMSKAQARDYFEWFKSVIPERLAILEREVRLVEAWHDWRADETPESLSVLGKWLAHTAKVESIDPVPVILNGRQVAQVTTQLTEETVTRCFDMGVYFGLMLVRSSLQHHWGIELKGGKRNANYGRAVVRGVGVCPCEPVTIMINLARHLTSGKCGSERLSELYHLWVKHIDVPLKKS